MTFDQPVGPFADVIVSDSGAVTISQGLASSDPTMRQTTTVDPNVTVAFLLNTAALLLQAAKELSGG